MTIKAIQLPEYPFHEISEIFPLMEGRDFAELKRDIEQNGQQEPIWLYQGRIIDGRNRYRACRDLGRPVLTREWDGNGSLVTFVQSLNLRRRHLDGSQRAMVAVRIKHRFEAEARERMLAGKRAEPSEKTDPRANLREGKASELAARQMGVSSRTVEAADKVSRNGTPSLVKAVERGDVAVSAAADIVDLPKPVQEKIVSKGSIEIARVAAKVREDRKANRVEVRRVAEPAPKPKPEESEGEAMDLLVKWSRTVSDLRLRLKSLKTEQIISLTHILKQSDREGFLGELKELAAVFAEWIEILEKPDALKRHIQSRSSRRSLAL